MECYQYGGARRENAAVARTLVAVSTYRPGTQVCPKSVHARIVFGAMLVSHGPLKTFPHGEEKGTMGLLIIRDCRECILEDFAHVLRAI
jgi:hypothetical protein